MPCLRLGHRARWLFALLSVVILSAGESRAETAEIQTAMLPPGAGSWAPGLFGSREMAANTLSALPQWGNLLSRMQAQRPRIEACDADPAACPSARVANWRAMIRNLRGQPQDLQLTQVNSYINVLVNYEPDSSAFGQSDYWATPLETLAGYGDCEDFAVLKFFSLLELGFSNDQMRVVVLTDARRGLGHAVLAVSLAGQEQILDNLYVAPLADRLLSDYVPLYSVNLTTRWAHLMPAMTLAQAR